MAHDVFISYSKSDIPVSNAVCSLLEARRIRCWMAPRDIRPGRSWARAISHAITESSVMVVILSRESTKSPHVLREVERAVSAGLAVIPFLIEDVQPSESMEFLISSSHWLDALSPPLERHIEELADAVDSLLRAKRRESRPSRSPSFPATAVRLSRDKKWKNKFRDRRYQMGAVALAVLFAIGAEVVLRPNASTHDETGTSFSDPSNGFAMLSPAHNATVLGDLAYEFAWTPIPEGIHNFRYEIERTTADGDSLVASTADQAWLEDTFEGPISWRVRARWQESDDTWRSSTWSSTRVVHSYSDALSRLRATGRVHVGVGWVDDMFVNMNDDGTLGGFEVELIRKLLSTIVYQPGDTDQVRVDFTKRDWGPEFFTLLEDDAIDLLLSRISITKERERRYDLQFTIPTITYPQSILVRSGEPVFEEGIVRVQTIGVLRNTTNENLALRLLDRDTSRLETFEPRALKDNYVAVRALIEGDIDGIVLDEPFAHQLRRWAAQTLDATLAVRDIDRSVLPDIEYEQIGFAIRTSDDALLEALNQAIRDNPDYLRLFERQVLSAQPAPR